MDYDLTGRRRSAWKLHRLENGQVSFKDRDIADLLALYGVTDEFLRGSYLTMYDSTDTSEQVVEAARIWNQSAKPPYHLRSPARIAGFFDGLELVEPGVVSTLEWRPEPSPSGPPAAVDSLCGIGRKP